MSDLITPMQRIARCLSALTHHLPAALMVSAIVSICHHQLHLLDAIDGYAFFGIGNLSAKASSRDIGGSPTVAVVLIDQKSHEDYYRERNPLDRCELKKDLEAIYTLPRPPKLLVVDLDLSPALPVDGPAGERDQKCEAQLKDFLMQQRSTRTVLMAPFDTLDPEAQANINMWRADLSRFVTFADPALRISYGLVNSIVCRINSIAATAFEQYEDKPRGVENCPCGKSDVLLRISPGHYFSGLRAMPVSQLSTRQLDSQPTARPDYEALYNLPVMFYGAGYGEGDLYITPVGKMYGVEVHAAAFMSLLQPTTDLRALLEFALDMGLALLLGGLFALSWQRYFSLRFSSIARQRQWAPWSILILALGLMVLVGSLTYLSFLLLRHCSIWLSPIPIALGMLIESFFNSAVTSAVGEGYEQRQALVRRLQAAYDDGPEHFASTVAVETEQRPHHAHSLQDRAARFFYLDYLRLLHSGQYGAFGLLFIRRMVFFLLLFFLFLNVFH